MARFPTLEEYQKRGNFNDGIKRCDDLMKKNPNNVQLLRVKLQLHCASQRESQPVLAQLLALQPPVVELKELDLIEEAIVKSQRNVYPPPRTAGDSIAKLWENAFKATTSIHHKTDLLSLRFSRAIVDDRIIDAQQALIQLKVLQPRNRVFYMAHAAVTALSTADGHDLSARLALSLAQKAVKEKFDEDSSLDCRVPGQIFVMQGSEKDLQGIVGRRFAESKDFHDAIRGNPTIHADKIVPNLSEEAAGNGSVTGWLVREIQSLKHQFADIIAAEASVEAFIAFAANATRLLRTSTTIFSSVRGRGPADAAFLAISALTKVFERTEEHRYVLQSAFLAEEVLMFNEHIHEARMILVYLYMRLGLGSLALKYFESLNVKEIQHDTVGHVIFTRMSYIHPHSTVVSGTAELHPLARMRQALAVYHRCEDKLAEAAASVLVHEQTGMIFDLHKLRYSLRKSMSRRIFILEQRRLSRLNDDSCGESTSQLGPSVIANWLDGPDNRDFATTFNFDYNVEKVLHSRNNMVPGGQSLIYSLAADMAWCMAMGFEEPVVDSAAWLTHLSDGTPLRDHATLGMSDAEYLGGELAGKVLRLLLHLKTDSMELARDVQAVVKGINLLNVETLTSTTNVFAEHLQDHYIYLDILRIVGRACSFAMKKTTDQQLELSQLQETAKKHCTAIQRHAKEQIQQIKSTDIQTFMTADEQDGSMRVAIDSFGEPALHSFCESVARSAQEGWEGLIRINIG